MTHSMTHYVFYLLAVLASLLVAGAVIRRAPETITNLPPAERRRAFGLVAVASLLLLDAFLIMRSL